MTDEDKDGTTPEAARAKQLRERMRDNHPPAEDLKEEIRVRERREDQAKLGVRQ